MGLKLLVPNTEQKKSLVQTGQDLFGWVIHLWHSTDGCLVPAVYLQLRSCKLFTKAAN